MSVNLQTLLRDAILNNTYDYSVLHDTLKNTWTNSYSYLYQLQKAYIEYEEKIYHSNDIDSRNVTDIGHLYVNKSYQACFDIDYDFIHVCNRDEFRRSRFYSSQFSFTDMVDNPNIFHKLPIILIDDSAIWDYKINLQNNTFTISLPFDKEFVLHPYRNENTNDLVYVDHKIQVFIVDNILYDRITVNRSQILQVSRLFNKYNTNKNMVIDTSWLKKTTDKEGIYFISVHIPNSIGNNYELGTILMPCEKNGDKIICKLSDDDYATINKFTKNLYVSVIFINQLHSHKFYTGHSYTVCESDKECNLFVLQRDESVPYAMPIPVENLMVLKERNGKLTYVHNTDMVELLYPNVYRIKDIDRQEGDIYYIYYFYRYAEYLKYTPMHHDFYYDFLKIHFNNEPIEKIIDNIYRGKIKYIEDIDSSEIDAILLNSVDPEDSMEYDYILACGSSEALSQVQHILSSNYITPAIINEAFLNTFNKILHYNFYHYNYGDIDFINRYLLEDGNADKDPIEYKDETLKEWIFENPDILREYVINQNKLYNSTYHLWTKNIDLQSKLRINTNTEMGDDGFNLPNECYVFAFNNDNINSNKHILNLRVFVDGLLVVGLTHVHHKFTDYIYIPKLLVTDDSYIEVEIYPSYEYSTVLNFSSLNDEKEIQLFEPTDNIYPTAQDIFYIEPVGHIMETINHTYTNSIPSNGDDSYKYITSESDAKILINGIPYNETTIYDPGEFRLTSVYDDKEYCIKTTDPEKPVVYTRLKTFKIKPLSENLIKKDLVLCISKIPNSIEIQIEKDSFPEISLAGLNFSFNTDYIRIFKNGRLVPKSKYILTTTYSFPRITFFEMVSKGDILYIDITPYRYNEIYYQKELAENQLIVDLTGYIDKPFDVRYYDVYLNGRKLSINNVISISPWKISLVNIKSIYNLQIFEKERDYEYFGTDFRNNKYYYTIDDLLESDYILNDEKHQLVQKLINDRKDKSLTIVPNENIEDQIDYGIDQRNTIYVHLFYTNIVVPMQFIDPDHLQLNNYYIKVSYPNIHDTFYSNPADSARNEEERVRKENYEGVFMLDPDKLVDGGDDTNTDTVIYPITYLNDVDDSIFDTTVTE